MGKPPQKGEVDLFYATEDQGEDLRMSPGFGNTAVMTDAEMGT